MKIYSDNFQKLIVLQPSLHGGEAYTARLATGFVIAEN